MNNPVPGLPGVINIHKKHDDGTLGSRHAVTVFFFFFLQFGFPVLVAGEGQTLV